MTLRILSPSRRSNRAEKKQDDQENRLAQGSAENVPSSPGLRRSTNSKQASPKRRRLPLRDSILLTRKDSAEFSTGTTSTDAGTPRKLPPPLKQQRARSETSEMSSMPSTPSKSRMPDLPRLGIRPRDHPPNVPQPPTPPTRLPPRETNLESCQAAVKNSANSSLVAEKPLVSRICSMILDEEFGAGADRSSTPLKVWDTVVRCLDDISRLAQPAASGKPGERLSSDCQALESRRPPRTAASGIGQTGVGDATVDNSRGPMLEAKVVEVNDKPMLGHLLDRHPLNRDSYTHSLPCPYRLRNPIRFNVSDKWQCATGKWKNLAELQAHIVKDHKQSGNTHLFQCPRCEEGFPEPAAFREHLMLPKDKMCDPRSEIPSTGADVEDGLTGTRARDLSDKVKSEIIKSWDDLWRWLFPSDKVAPRPVILPAVELPQVEQEVFASSNMSSLKASLEERLRLLAMQLANDDSFSAQIPVITGSLSLVVEAHLRSVFIACRNQPPGHSRKISLTKDSVTGRPRNLSSASTSSARSIDRLDHRGPVIALNETQGTMRDAFRAQSHRKRSNSDESRPAKSSRAVTLPISTMLTIPFPRISVLTEQSDVGPSLVSEDGNGSPNGPASDAEYSSGVDSSPSSVASFRESNNTDIRCSKCNMRPSLRPDEDIFADPNFSGRPSTVQTQDPTCRFSDSGIGILCKSCRMLEELINSYSRTSSPAAKSEGRSGVARSVPKGAETTSSAPLFSPDSSILVDESEEETLFDLILDSATYLDEEGNRKTEIVPSMFPLPPVQVSKYDRFGQDDNFF
ncbi:hypothetical protein CSPAE12_03033 [Colletotrichum incanum]|nr:hypothetical protein CSPAE12_03033 [Colletotrichum incanum]